MSEKFKFISKIYNYFDIFGKEVDLYYKGRARRNSWIGCLFTFLYAGMYIAFFVYKLVIMFKRTDVTFYETNAFTGEEPYIQLTPDKFYGGFALVNPYTRETYINDTIYTASATFYNMEKRDGSWTYVTLPKTFELEPCKLENFGEKYRELFKEKKMDKMHCIPKLNETLRGHLTYDRYSYYKVSFTPCINSTKNNNHCQPLMTIMMHLTQAAVTFKMEDIDITPQDYSNPVVLRAKEVSATVGKLLFQDIHSYFQVVNIETDEDFIGFEALSSIKKEKYIKYDESIILSNLKPNNLNTAIWNESIVDVTVNLSEKELTQKRTYPKLIVVLGDVGGFMEIFYSLFNLLSIFLTDSMFKISLVNHLFSFDVNKKLILIKNKNLKNNNCSLVESIDIYNQAKNYKNSNENISLKENNNISYETNCKLKNDINIKKKKKKKKRGDIYSLSAKHLNKKEDDILSKNKNDYNNKDSSARKDTLNNVGSNNKTLYNKTTIKETQLMEDGIIHKIKLSKCFIYFCSCKKKKPLHNVLLDEGIKIIIEKLDIQNLFKMIYKEEKNNQDFNCQIEMSNECKKNLLNYCRKVT